MSELEKQARAIFSELLKQAQGPNTGSLVGDCEAWPECGVTSVEQFVEFTVPILAAFATQVREKAVQEKWVSVTERLPDLSKYVLVWMPDYRATWVINRLEDDKGDWHWWEDGEYCHDKKDVTHWQSLPAPPESTEEGK